MRVCHLAHLPCDRAWVARSGLGARSSLDSKIAWVAQIGLGRQDRSQIVRSHLDSTSAAAGNGASVRTHGCGRVRDFERVCNCAWVRTGAQPQSVETEFQPPNWPKMTGYCISPRYRHVPITPLNTNPQVTECRNKPKKSRTFIEGARNAISRHFWPDRAAEASVAASRAAEASVTAKARRLRR